MYLVSDVHQPLHCADNDDQRGSDVSVVFYNDRTDLHKVWDHNIVEKTLKDRKLSESVYAQELNKSIDLSAQYGTPIQWAEESHKLAIYHAYNLPPDNYLGDKYYAENNPIVEDQMKKAGIRLARILNETLR